jgi:mannose-6-phosphate isomerase-like protein (cupin superfamily)
VIRKQLGFVVHEEECAVEGADDGPFGSLRWRTLVSGDRTPSDSLTVGVAELEPGESGPFTPHRHAQPEVYYILSGTGSVVVAGVVHPVRPGSTVFIPGDTEHGARNTGDELLRLLYVFPADAFSDVEYEFPGS